VAYSLGYTDTWSGVSRVPKAHCCQLSGWVRLSVTHNLSEDCAANSVRLQRHNYCRDVSNCLAMGWKRVRFPTCTESIMFATALSLVLLLYCRSQQYMELYLHSASTSWLRSSKTQESSAYVMSPQTRVVENKRCVGVGDSLNHARCVHSTDTPGASQPKQNMTFCAPSRHTCFCDVIRYNSFASG